MSGQATKTRTEIEALKASWYGDPCWDIEQTEGFAAYGEELRTYRAVCERLWQERFDAARVARSQELGISPAMVRYLDILEYELDRLQRRLERLERG